MILNWFNKVFLFLLFLFYKLCDSFMIFWNKNKQDILNGNNSKLDTYFSLKNCFDREKYTQIHVNDFKICHSPSLYVS